MEDGTTNASELNGSEHSLARKMLASSAKIWQDVALLIIQSLSMSPLTKANVVWQGNQTKGCHVSWWLHTIRNASVQQFPHHSRWSCRNTRYVGCIRCTSHAVVCSSYFKQKYSVCHVRAVAPRQLTAPFRVVVTGTFCSSTCWTKPPPRAALIRYCVRNTSVICCRIKIQTSHVSRREGHKTISINRCYTFKSPLTS